MAKFKAILVAASLLVIGGQAFATEKVEVFKSPYCGCCGKWIEHMQQAGFEVITQNVEDVGAARKAAGMPDQYASCHTAKVGGYVVEGHVPAKDVVRLLKEKPKAIGVAAPGMPAGSPGMEAGNPQPYDTLLIKSDGSAKVFTHHKP